MIIEAIVVFAAIPIIMSEKVKHNIMASLATSISWRALFVVYMYGSFAITGRLAKWLGTPNQAISFIVLNGVIAASLVLISITIERISFGISWGQKRIPASYALVVTLLAIGSTFAL